ncbi:MAG: helix-turn-helix domain-containing protein, partial [Nitrospinota bacterium]
MGEIVMSDKERRRLGVIVRVESGDLKLSDASEILGVSYRQVKRIRKRYREEGDIGLVHKSRGQESNRGYKDALKAFALNLYRQRYPDFGPTLFSEKLLEEHGTGVDHETLRQWLMKEGLWLKSRNRSKHRSWRQRKAHFGELVQMDGSHHRWFEDRREKCCLMVMVDDATGKTISLMSEEETTAS